MLTPLSLDDARRIVADYVELCNTVRLHGAIGYVTPKDKLEGRDPEIFAARDRKLAEARERRKQQRRPPRTGTARGTPGHRLRRRAFRRHDGRRPAPARLPGAPASRGAQRRGPCPLHGATAGAARCFSVNLEDHTFHCFRCGRSGNALDLWARARASESPYDAALDLCQH